MPKYDFRVQHGSVLLGMTHRRLCDPMKGQSIKFMHGPIEYRLKVVAVEPRSDSNTVVRLTAEGLSIEYLKNAHWKEVNE